MIDLDELRVPKTLRLVADEIVAITDAVCRAVLDEEYADLARRAVAKLARKRPSPLTAGRRATWAAGVVYALGQANFVFDPASEPYVTADELSEAFGVAKSTMGSKARQVRDLLRISPFSPEFERADVAAQNPLMWIIEVNGLAVTPGMSRWIFRSRRLSAGSSPTYRRWAGTSRRPGRSHRWRQRPVPRRRQRWPACWSAAAS